MSQRVSLGALKGCLYIRIQELATPAALVRSLVALLLSFGLALLPGLDPNGAADSYRNVMGSIFALTFLPFYALVKGGETLRNELKEGTIEFLWTRPASKVELFLGFYFSGLLSCISIVLPILLGGSLAGIWLGALDLGSLLGLWLVCGSILFSFAAVSAALGAFSAKFIVMSIFYFSFVEVGLGQIPNGVRQLAITYHGEQMLGNLETLSLNLSGFAWILGIGMIALALGASLFTAGSYVAGGEKEG